MFQKHRIIGMLCYAQPSVQKPEDLLPGRFFGLNLRRLQLLWMTKQVLYRWSRTVSRPIVPLIVPYAFLSLCFPLSALRVTQVTVVTLF